METWRKDLVSQLRGRNRREVEPYRDLFAYHARAFEKLAQLQAENKQLTLQNERLTTDAVSGAAEAGGGGGVATSEEVALLKRKVYDLQEELTALHRRKGENAQQVIDLTNKVRELEEAMSERTARLEQAKIDAEGAERQLESTKKKLVDLEATNQLLKDEYQALQLTLSGFEQKLLAAQKENDRLIAQVMEYKERDVAKLNRENDEYVRKRQESVKRQLEEAALENKAAVVVKERPQSVGTETLDSIICTVARVPNKAYLKFDAHDGEVNAVRWAPHGLLLATGGADRRTKLWDVSTGKEELRGSLTGCNGAVMSLDFDAAGALLIAGSTDFAARVWSAEDSRLRHTLTGHSGKVLAARFLGENTRVCTGSHDRTLRVWDLRSRSCTSTLFPGSMVNDVVCLDQLVISGHVDKKLRFYDVRRGTQPTSEAVLTGKVTSLDLARNGVSLLACTRDDRLEMLDLRSPGRGPVKSFRCDGFSVGCDYTRAVFSPDSSYVSVGSSEGTVFVWEVEKAPDCPERALRGHDGVVVAVAWQPAGNGMVSCDKNKKVVVWADI